MNTRKEYNKKRWVENKEKIQKQNKQYYENNKDKVLNQQKNYNSQPEVKERNKEYWKTPKVKSIQLKYQNKRNKENPSFYRWRGLLTSTLKRLKQNKLTSTQTLLGYSSQQLKEYLDKQGMDWNNHEIDHKIPITWFKPETPPYIVNDLRNLQPLDKTTNIQKSNNINTPVSKEYYEIVKQHIIENKQIQLEF